jgi:RimJ/RimL family protein N-acetyltransferase
MVDPAAVDGFVPHDEVLRDGTTIAVRSIQPSDGPRLIRFHATLSFESIRTRFFGVHPFLSASETERFTTVDHRDREALIALVDDEIIGVGRYDRLASGVDAEVAFVVSDRWQRRGLAPILLELLAVRARDAGISTFVAETLADNLAMVKVFRHSGLTTTTTWASGEVHVTMQLGPPPGGGAVPGSVT